jgi:hypothetical protein
MNNIEIAKVSKDKSLKTPTISIKRIVSFGVKDMKIHKNKG